MNNILNRVCELVDQYVAKHGTDHEMTSGEFKKWVSDANVAAGNEPIGIQPSDVCYNRYNAGLGDFADWEYTCLVYNLETKKYRLVGTHYKYSGPVWQYADRRDRKRVGKCKNGKYTSISE